MNTLYAIIGLLSLVIAGSSLIALPFRRLRRRAALVFGASVVAFVVSISLLAPEPAKVAVASQSEATKPNDEATATPNTTAERVTDRPLSTAKSGSPGVARICLTDKDIHLNAKDEIVIPATTVFDDEGPNTGNPKDPASWGYDVKERFGMPAQLTTLDAVTLRKGDLCADAKVRVLSRKSTDDQTKRASDNHIFTVTDVVDYPIPTSRPRIEIGKLIDDISIEAVLIVDVTQAVTKPELTSLSDAENAAKCLAGAKKLAAYLGGGVGQQRSAEIDIGHVGAANVSYGCPLGTRKSDFAVYWDGRARPSSDIMALIAKGGAFVTGATPTEITMETSACVAAALKPNAAELADREVRGVKLECQAFARDGGGGSVTIYRRFGDDPVLPDVSASVAMATDAVSREIKADNDREAAAGLRFAQWYLDPSIPQSVKVFAMMAARVVSLEQRCRSSRSHDEKIARWASDAGVQAADIEPGGRYAPLMEKMLEQMKAGVATESVAEACEAIKKYD